MAWMLSIFPNGLKTQDAVKQINGISSAMDQSIKRWSAPMAVGDVFKPATDASSMVFIEIEGDQNYLAFVGYSYSLAQWTGLLVSSFSIDGNDVVPLMTRQDMITGVMAMCDAGPVIGSPDYTYVCMAGSFISELATAYMQGYEDGRSAGIHLS